MDNDKIKDLQEGIITGDIPKIIDTSIQVSLQKGSSDIHIEPQQGIVKIRMRIDGILKVIVEYPLNLHSGMVSKLKLMSNLRIDETRIPQDGRINTFAGEKEVDLRLSTLPTPNGEKICMRVLDKSKTIPTLEQLGIIGANYKKFTEAVKQPNGIILTSGPTGSGKTTSMYSALTFIKDPGINIMTLEDPIENQMDGLNQSQMQPNIGYTFAQGIRTALRQDPDVIMVGEIRDKETIDVAIEASLTGHLVLSTIHTNSAVDTITRILNMKVPDFLLTASVNLIIAQRLARRLCKECSQPQQISETAIVKIKEAFRVFKPYQGLDMGIFQKMEFKQPNPEGCEVCNGTGYKGRVGIYEILEVNDRFRKTILEGAVVMEMQKVAQEEGMVTLEQDGVIKALQGVTSLEEVYKLVKA